MTHEEHYDAVSKAASKVYAAIDRANSHGLCVYVGMETIYAVGGKVTYSPEVFVEHVSRYRDGMTADEKQCRHEVYEAMLNLSSVLTDAAEFGYSFKIERYRDGMTIVRPAESKIEA